ncbi:hypothetical protein SDC9_31943 [bioreactor metagenome]|uniref:Uncharacterized protein n=3 Tax=root TaxID=1 RepID=A0A644V439_9ZZZZ
MELDQNSLRACSRAAQATRAIRLRRARLKYAVLCLAALCVCLCLMTVGVFAARAAEVQTAQDQNSGSLVEQRGEQKNTPPPAGDTATPAPSAANTPVEVRELWTGSLYSSTYRVGVCVSAQGTVRGVVHLRLYNGKVDVYHIDGTVRNNDIEAHHSSGHSFKGRLASADKVEGVISLKNGMNVRLEGKRIHDAPLAPEDCAPLPQ